MQMRALDNRIESPEEEMPGFFCVIFPIRKAFQSEIWCTDIFIYRRQLNSSFTRSKDISERSFTERVYI